MSFLVLLIDLCLAGIFCVLRGRNLASTPMKFMLLFSSFEKKNPNLQKKKNLKIGIFIHKQSTSIAFYSPLIFDGKSMCNSLYI